MSRRRRRLFFDVLLLLSAGLQVIPIVENRTMTVAVIANGVPGGAQKTRTATGR